MSKPIEVRQNQGFTGETRGRSIEEEWRVVLASCGFGPGSAAGEEPPAAGHDRAGDGLM